MIEDKTNGTFFRMVDGEYVDLAKSWNGIIEHNCHVKLDK